MIVGMVKRLLILCCLIRVKVFVGLKLLCGISIWVVL